MFEDFDSIGFLLRTLVLMGSIASAGAVLYDLSMKPTSATVKTALRRQLWFGIAIILISEPLRYWFFLMLATGNEVELATSRDMMVMGLQAPSGQAGLLRLAGVGALALFGLRFLPLSVLGALLVIVSFGFEGHMAASQSQTLTISLLLVHVAIAHWWFGALFPLIAESYHSTAEDLAEIAERFGFVASFLVPVLLFAGATMFAILIQWKVDLTNGYQWRMSLKIITVTLLLALAALNKFHLTPALRSEKSSGAARLRFSIYIESFVALCVLAFTSFLTATSPDV